MSGRLIGKVALVTGASSGIGRASAQAFAREGASVFICDIDDEGAAETVEIIQQSDGDAVALHMDICSGSSVEETFARIDALNQVATVVMNCAGGVLSGDGSIDAIEEDAWARAIALNLTGTYRVCKAAVQRMLRDNTGGSIINLSARAALNGVGIHAYAAAKGGVAALSRSLGVTYGPQQIRCNALAPGPVDTRLISGWMADPVKREKNLAGVPLGRPAQPAEIAELAVYLASDESAFMTASVMPIDGGASAQ